MDVRLSYSLVVIWSLSVCSVQAKENFIVDHIDTLIIDQQLTLTELINQTIKNYPDVAVIDAIYRESNALSERGNQWFSAPFQFQAYYKDDFLGSAVGSYEFDGTLQVSLWNWGQRTAGKKLSDKSRHNASEKMKEISLKVAGLVRAAIWSLKQSELEYTIAKQEFQLVKQLTESVNKRYQYGDLSKADFLMTESELLQKKNQLVGLEAKLMHARNHYFFLTQDHSIPKHIFEKQSDLNTIIDSHPALTSINALIDLKKAKLDWVKAQGAGQSTFGIGGVTERGARGEPVVDSLAVNITIPFGGEAFLAPQIAAANRELVTAQSNKLHLIRLLQSQLHEAVHALQVDRERLSISKKLQKNAKKQLKMADVSFESGEINIMDFLKIQSQSLLVIKQAKQSKIQLHKDIALYNQAVGVLP